jgi:spore coat protein U-like protein
VFSLVKKGLVLFFCLSLMSPAFAAEIQTTRMLVSVNVLSGCIITATPLVFGLYNPNSATSTKSTARLRLLCTLNTPYNVALDQGAGEVATTRLRTLSGPDTQVIRYTLSQNATHTVNWGNILGVDTLLGTGTGVQQYLTVYGEIPAKQNVSMGAYRDVVNVSVIF